MSHSQHQSQVQGSGCYDQAHAFRLLRMVSLWAASTGLLCLALGSWWGLWEAPPLISLSLPGSSAGGLGCCPGSFCLAPAPSLWAPEALGWWQPRCFAVPWCSLNSAFTPEKGTFVLVSLKYPSWLPSSLPANQKALSLAGQKQRFHKEHHEYGKFLLSLVQPPASKLLSSGR